MRRALAISLEALLYLIVYVLISLLCNILLGFFIADSTLLLVLSQLSASGIIIIVFIATHWATIGLRCLSPLLHTTVWLWLLLLAIAVIILLVYAEEVFAVAMPAEYEQLFRMIISHKMGYLTVAILAPMAEEIVFRGAILRKLLSLNCHSWVAIVVSALLFGAVHGNVAQGCNGFLMGLLFGWLYARTGSILPSLLIHWLNNSISFLTVRLFPDTVDPTLSDLCGGNMPLVYAVVALSVVVAVVSLRRIHILIR